MMRSITVAALFAAAVCAQPAQKKSDQTATTSAPPPASQVPKDAVKNANGTWSYTDKQGKKWLYINSPFGVMKRAEVADESEPTRPVNAATRIIDKGDTVRFEQPSPFGAIVWEKKKSDLTDQERQMMEAQKQKQTEPAKPDTK